MAVDSISSPNSRSALVALAVLERARLTALAALLERELSADEMTSLRNHPEVNEVENVFVLAATTAADFRTALERNNLPVYRQLHERALSYLGKRLRSGDETAESTWLAVYERLASRLLADDPQGLVTLVDTVRDLPLQSAAARHRRTLFEGIALRRTEQYEAALTIYDSILADADLEPYLRARTLNSRAICYRLTGRLEEALAGYNSSLILWRQLGNKQYEGIVLMNIGIIAYELHQHDQAESHLRQAEIILEEIGAFHWLAVVHNELGLLHRDQGEWPLALAYFNKFIIQRRAEGADDHVGLGLNNIGEVYLFQGRLAEAANALREALASMATRLYRVDAWLHLGLVYQAQADSAQAKAAFIKALTLAQSINRREILPHAHYRLGALLYKLGERDEALTQFETAIDLVEAMRERLQEERIKISLLGKWQQIYEAAILYHLVEGDAANAFTWAERARARAFAEAVVTSEQSMVTAAEVQRQLPPDTAVLYYFTTGVLEQDLPLLQAILADNPLRHHLLTPPQTWLFKLTHTRLTAHQCTLDPNALISSSPRKEDRTRFWQETILSHLYNILLKPVREVLTLRHLIIVPHGPLHRLPFAALRATDGQPLVRSGGPYLSYSPSATMLLRHLRPLSKQTTTSQRSCLALGYNGSHLHHSEAEASHVAAVMEGEAWLGPVSKKERLQQVVPDYRWLHMACHGRFNAEKPLSSYLEIGQGERLTAEEILRSWHLSAELVTLSACQTGLNHILRGDEPMGLVRAFLSAGAKAILVTQWPVEDLPTFLFMRHFYGYLRRGEKPAAALHTAQIRLRTLRAHELRHLLADLTSLKSLTNWDSLSGEFRPFSHQRIWAAFALVEG